MKVWRGMKTISYLDIDKRVFKLLYFFSFKLFIKTQYLVNLNLFLFFLRFDMTRVHRVNNIRAR